MADADFLASDDAADPPLTRKLALSTQDLDLAREHIGRVFVSHGLDFRSGARALAFRHHYARLSGISFNLLEYGGDVMVNAPALGDFYLIQFTLAGACEIACGGRSVILPRGMALAMNPTRPYRKSWSADCRQLLVRIDRALLQRQLAAMLGIEARRPLEFALEPLDVRTTGATLARLVEMVCRDLDTMGGVSHRSVQRQIVGSLAAVLLTTMPHNHSRAVEGTSPAIPFCIRRAEDYMREFARRDLTLDDIARAACISTRSLHRSFRRFRETTPMAYLKAVRLDLARRELLTAHPAERNVTEIAAACGLLHPGRFARDYKARFGETPSDTLRFGTRVI